MEKLGLLIGMAAGGFYLYNEMEKNKEEGTGQTDITGEGTDVFQKIDRVLAYRLLKAAHEEVTDFDVLTDTDLAQLLTSINIDPNVLKTRVTAEQAEFLMNSAKEAARLRTEITIDIETKKQWNIVIRAHENQKVLQWVASQNIQLETQYAESNNKYYSLIGILDEKFETYITTIDPMYGMVQRHCPKQDVFDYITHEGISADPLTINKINNLWDARISASGTLYPRWVVDDILIPLIAFLKKAWTDEKQTHVDLLATQAAGKKAIITSTDYTSLLWTVSENGTINEPSV